MGRLCSSKGGACAMAQWHNGQSKPEQEIGIDREYFAVIKRFCTALIWINFAVKLNVWTLTFRKVVRQQISGEVAVQTPASCAVDFLI